MDNTYFTIFVSVVTLWALFGDDIRILAVDSYSDNGFYWMTITCFLIFSVEILLSWYAKDDYFNTFFFWLDLVSTATLLLDVGWISDMIFKSDSASSGSASAGQVAKAAKTSRIGTRAARIIRIIRLIRLIRIVKLYKAAEKERLRQERDEKSKRRTRMRNLAIKDFNSSFQKGSEDRGSKLKNELESDGQKSLEAGQKAGESMQERENSVQKGGAAAGRNKIMPFQGLMNPPMSDPRQSIAGASSLNPGSISQVSNGSLSQMVDENLDEEFKESNVGKTLISNITKIVIVLILLIMFSIPIFTSGTYMTDDYNAQNAAVKQIERAVSRYDLDYAFFQHTFDSVYENFRKSSIPIYYGNVTRTSELTPTVYELIIEKGNLKNANGLRSDETTIQATDPDTSPVYSYKVDPVTGNNITYTWTVALSFQSRRASVLGAWLGICRTVFVCLILTISVLKLSRDSEILVIGPLEKMVKNVKKISMNPLEAADLEEKEAENRENLERNHPDLWQEYKEQNEYEPAMLEKIIVKIGTLLAIGFGEAGSDIIAANTKSGGTVNPMLGGKKVVAIFGFCDIRAFSEITEVLKKDVMIFVNEVAEIVHSMVNEHQGAANKNIGEAFLLIWKLPDTIGGETENGPQMEADPKSSKNRALADLAVLAFIKVLAGINRSKKLEKYKDNPELKARFHHDYKVNMGFGLHIGWGIEGAIGSKFKIDASYLSPNVNMSARLEAATRQFGVSILVR